MPKLFLLLYYFVIKSIIFCNYTHEKKKICKGVITMNLPTGVYIDRKKSGEIYYRSSITYQGKHISLGSYEKENEAHQAYLDAKNVLNQPSIKISQFEDSKTNLAFEKWVVLINYRDHNIYIKTPIYLMKFYFIYYLDPHINFKFDVDDLFYYSHHKIMRRGGHLFVSDYGMQINILSRYGIKSYAVPGRDYIFINGDSFDLRYSNIEICNPYHGVVQKVKTGKVYYEAKVHINGDYLVGRYSSATEAAIAYNKAVLLLKEKNIRKNYTLNYIEHIEEIEYAKILHQVRISKKIRELKEK